MKILIADSKTMADVTPARIRGIGDWQRWVPYAAIAWSLAYAALGAYWAVSGRGFPYAPETRSALMGPILARFAAGVVWFFVILAGIPAAVVGAAMLRGLQGRLLRLFLLIFGSMLSAVLLLLMTSLDLLVLLGYIPYIIFGLISGIEVSSYLEGYTQWTTIHQLLCLIGGFLWLAASVGYNRRSTGACLYCGRQDGTDGWQSPSQAARWGRVAVYVAMIAPLLYALIRYAWALGIPLGMSAEHLRRGQESGVWISGLFLASFGLVGALLMLGLVQRWGEVFPPWILVLAGRRVPIALAVVPAALVSVLLFVGGIGVWLDLDQLVANAVTAGAEGIGLVGEIIFQVGPILLFPVWGVALAVATLGYYYRQRSACRVCGRGASS